MIAKKKQFGTNYIFFIIFFYLTLVVVCAAWWSINKLAAEMKDRIYPSVFIDYVSFGGKTTHDIKNYFDKKNSALKKITFTILYQNTPISTLSAQALNLHYDSQSLADHAYLISRSSNLSSNIYQKIATILHWQRFDFTSNLEYDWASLKEFISVNEETYNKPAKNALFKFENGRVVSFRQEEKGNEIQSDKFYSDFDSAVHDLRKNIVNKTVELTAKTIYPEISLAKANNLGIEDLIAVGKSNYSYSIPERIHNIILASSKFNGVLIPKDKIFSFNQTVGDISSLTGYKPAYIIKEGKTVLGDGGGVCQVSTTLFRAALNAGLPIVERVAHAYRVGYYENDSKPGFDATVYDPYADLKIKNDTQSSILIETDVDEANNLLFFKFYGKKDERKVIISPASLSDVMPPPDPLYQDDPTLKKGQTKQIDFAAWGGKASFNYKVIRDDQIIFQKTFFSNYRPWQAVYLRGTAD